MSYEKYSLPNGLKVILKHKDVNSIHIQINFNVGSINEKEGEKGYSHLVEHLLFEGTKKRRNAQIICSEIENIKDEIELNLAQHCLNKELNFILKIKSRFLI